MELGLLFIVIGIVLAVFVARDIGIVLIVVGAILMLLLAVDDADALVRHV